MKLLGQRCSRVFFSGLNKERIKERIYKTRDLTKKDISN